MHLRSLASSGIVSALAATALTVAPTAAADYNFVSCEFGVSKPYIYTEGGQDYVGATMDATDCRTNLPSTPIVLELDIAPSTQQPDGSWQARTVTYHATIDVVNGGAYSVKFPNDGQLIPLLPGGYLASGTAISSLPGYMEPQHISAEMMAWGVPYIPT